MLTLEGRRGKPEQALAENPHTLSLVFLNPILRREEVRGFKDTWSLSLWQRHIATSRRCSGLILQSGAPSHPQPRASLSSAKGRGAGGALYTSLPRAADQEPLALGRLSVASPLLRGCAGSPCHPHPRLALSPSLQPSRPERAHRGSGTWARGRRRLLLPLPEPKPEPARLPSMLQALRPPSAQPLAQAQKG